MSNEKKFVDIDYPEIAKLFKYPEESHVGSFSSKKVAVVCPYCGREKEMAVSSLVKLGHVTCSFCSDGFPYTEKLMSNILTQLGIEFEYQFQPNWAKPYIYDYAFIHNGEKIILELDGGIGHGRKNTLAKKSIKQSLLIDNLKDDLATENGYRIYRIDCDYGHDRFGFLKNKYEDFLKTIFDTSKINWETANKKALNSKFWEVVNYYKNTSKYVEDISECLNIKQRTVKKYLYEAMQYGFVDKNLIITHNPFKSLPKHIKIVDESHLYHRKGNPVLCADENIAFDSVATLANYYGYTFENVLHALRKCNGYYNFHLFVFLKDLPEDYDFEMIDINLSDYNKYSRKKIIYQYDKKMNLVKSYKGVDEVSQKYNMSSIYNAIYERRGTAFGYIWSYDYLVAS